MAEIDYNVIASEVLNILKNSGKDLSGLPAATSPSGLQLAPVLKTEGGATTAYRIDIALLKGDTGAQGPKGDKGDKGDTGAQGPQGIQGPKGDGLDYSTMTPEEIANITGKSAYDVAVDNGFTGTESEWLLSLKGIKGDKGESGATGAQGLKGDTGAQGPKGDKGDKGDTGAQGLQGLKGDTGAQGLQGLKGDKGDPGEIDKIEKTFTLAAVSWVQAAELWTYIIYDADFKENSMIEVIQPLPTSMDSAVFQDAEFYAAAKASVEFITLYAKNKPEADITITYIIF